MDQSYSAPFDETTREFRYWSPLLNAVLIVVATTGLIGYLASAPMI